MGLCLCALAFCNAINLPGKISLYGEIWHIYMMANVN